MLHKIIAFILAIMSILILNGNVEYYSEIVKMINNPVGIVKAGRYFGTGNLLFIYIIAGLAVYFIGFGEHASKHFSPKAGGLWEPMVSSGWFVFLGYLFTILLFFLLEMYT